MPVIQRECLECNKHFYFSASPSRVAAGWGKFCSRSCKAKNHALKFRPWEANRGKVPWNFANCIHLCTTCGKEFTQPPSDIAKFCSNRCKYIDTAKRNTGVNSPNWKGDGVGYGALHKWVTRHLGKPQECKHCGMTEDRGSRGYHWANISGKYIRDLKDWVRLCVSCHSKFDKSRKVLT